MHEALELAGHDDVDEKHRKAQGHDQAAARLLEVLLLAAEPHLDTARELQVRELRLHPQLGPAQVEAGQGRVYFGPPHVAQPTDLAGAFQTRDLSDASQGDGGVTPGIDVQLPEPGHRAELLSVHAHADVDFPLQLGEQGGYLALDLDLENAGHRVRVCLRQLHGGLRGGLCGDRHGLPVRLRPEASRTRPWW